MRYCVKNHWNSKNKSNNDWFYRFIRHNFDEGLKYSELFPTISLFSVFGNRRKLYFDKWSRIKIFYTGENVHNENNPGFLTYYDNCINSVDLAIGFDYLNADNYIRLPLWILYFFEPEFSKDDIVEKISMFNQRRFQKTIFCSLIARHDSSGIRQEILNNVNKIEKVDCAGSFINNDTSLKEIYNDNKHKYLEAYKFNICPENSNYPGYVTEKLFEAIWCGCIPIYWGNEQPENKVINNEQVIHWKIDSDNSENIRLIKELHKNKILYKSFKNRERLKSSAVDYIWNIYENLQSKLNDILIRKKLLL